jgi:adenylate cyclase
MNYFWENWRMEWPSRAVLVRSARLCSGLTLFSYLATHFANHALGLISLGAMEAGRVWFLAVWRSAVGTTLLYSALTVHIALALYSLHQRRHFRIPLWEALQLLLGLAVPGLLAAHIVGTRLAHTWFGTTDSYTSVVLAFWVLRPVAGVRQVILLTVAWVHGCMGLHFWLRLKLWYSRLAPGLFALALLLPVLALLGFTQAGREVARLAEQSGWVQQTLRAANVPDPAARASLDSTTLFVTMTFALLVALVLIGRAVRYMDVRGHETVRVSYPAGQESLVPAGSTVLEASRLAGIPHASECGGRGRCTTCRVRVVQGAAFLPQSSPEERRILKRLGAPPNVRLACQLRPTHPLSVIPLLPATARSSDAFVQPETLAEQEREIAVLFADLRGFTRIAEHKLPYDVVFLLNRYFDVVGGAIERAGGIANQFTGDGVMALFGVQAGVDEACRQALVAAGDMAHGLAELSRTLTEELKMPLEIGIGIHAGPAVVGHMGRGVALYLTAVGDTVHVASRLQDLTKEYGCQLVISEPVAQRAGIDVSRFPRHELTVRNRQNAIVIRTIDDARNLAMQSRGPEGPPRP